MGLIRKLLGKPKPKHKAVQVLFRDIQPLDLNNLPLGGAYTYYWRLPTEPEIGQWVYVEGVDGKTIAVIAALGPGQDTSGMTLKPVLGLVPANKAARDVTAHQRKHNKALEDWFNQARRATGQPTTGRTPRATPDRYPPVPPTEATSYTKILADEYGRTWYRIYKEAEENGLPKADVHAFRAAAFKWFARRDRLSK